MNALGNGFSGAPRDPDASLALDARRALAGRRCWSRGCGAYL